MHSITVMKPSREFKIGFFVLSVLLVSFFVINFLRGKDIFNREMSLVASYGNIDGLVPSDPVYVRGFKAGSVSSIEYNSGTGLFDVTCSVLKKFSIPDDSRMTIYSRDIMGGKAVRIDMGKSVSCVCDGDRLEASVQPDMLASLSEQMSPLLAKVTKTAENMDSITVAVNSILCEENRSDIRKIIVRLERTAAEAEKISAAIGGKSDELSGFIGNISALSSRLDSLAIGAGKSMSDINSMTAALDSADIAGLIVSFKCLVESLQDPDGTIGRLATDGDIYDSLNSLVTDADSLLVKIQKNPKKFIRISLF